MLKLEEKGPRRRVGINEGVKKARGKNNLIHFGDSRMVNIYLF